MDYCCSIRVFCRAKALLLALVVSFQALPQATAQLSLVEQAEVGAIVSAVPALGTLDAGSLVLVDGSYFETWSFTVVTSSSFSMDLVSADFDTFGSISLPDDTIVASNDDCPPGVGTDSCLANVVIAPGTYYVGVGTGAAATGGDYSLTMTITAIPEPTSGLLFLFSGGLLMLRRRRG